MRELKFLGLASALFVLSTLEALACSCSWINPDERLKGARLIFHGKVVATQIQHAESSEAAKPFLSHTLQARFKVVTLYKGPLLEEVDIGSGAGCEITFPVGEEFTVFAYGTQEVGYRASFCSVIRHRYTATDDEPYLNAIVVYRARRKDMEQALKTQGEEEQRLREYVNFLLLYGDIEVANLSLLKLLSSQPKDTQLLLKRAQVRYDLERHEAALEDFRAVLAIEPSNSIARKGQTLSLLKLRRTHELTPDELDFSGFSDTSSPYLSLAGLKLRGANFRGTNLSNTDFSNTDLSNADFSEATLASCNFTYSTLTGARFEELKAAHNTLFSNANLRNTSFKKANFSFSTFKHANLDSANFSDAHGETSSFEQASLVNTDFSRARLMGTSFKGSVLQNTNFAHTDLRGTDFRESTLKQVNLSHARLGGIGYGRGKTITDLRGVDLSSASINDLQWDTVRIDCQTKVPEGFAFRAKNVTQDGDRCNDE